jgi:uncharacterized membrane protein YqgA involved in biofilm formation
MLIIPRGTLLNTCTVAAGGAIGWAVGEKIPPQYQSVVLAGLGLVTIGLGLKMFLDAKQILVIAGAVAFGGILGLLLGLQSGINSFAEWAKHVFGGEHSGRFVEAVVTTSILYCVGPLTLLGCLQDALENRIDLLAIKSVMDGIGSIFFAAALGPGVLVTAGVVLVVQSLITWMAKPLQPLAKDPELLSEVTGAGGIMLLGIGFGLLEIKHLEMANYIPSLFLAPLFVVIMRRFPKRRRV